MGGGGAVAGLHLEGEGAVWGLHSGGALQAISRVLRSSGRVLPAIGKSLPDLRQALPTSGIALQTIGKLSQARVSQSRIAIPAASAARWTWAKPAADARTMGGRTICRSLSPTRSPKRIREKQASFCRETQIRPSRSGR